MRWLALLASCVSALLVAVALPAADRTRQAREIDNALLFLPSGEDLRVASSGQAEMIADLLWVKTVLTFGERWEVSQDQTWVTWLERMIDTVSTLDPGWRTPYFYGGIVLRVLDLPEASNKVFLRGHEALPEDWFFPFSLGMNAYLADEDSVAAAEWVGKAADLPQAPTWLASLAAEFKQRSGDRSRAIAYLEGVKARGASPEVLADADRQLARLRHNELVDGWTPICREFRARAGRALASPEELEALVGQRLPPNPRADAWVVGADGVVRGAQAEAERRRRARLLEWELLR